MIKKNYFLLPMAVLLITASCSKDPILVETTDPVGAPIIVPIVAPPTSATDSTLVMGNPSNASTNVADFSNYLLKEGYYSVSYNRDRGTPNWVSWHVVSTDYGSVPRQDNFRANPALPADWYKVDNLSYSSSGFDRGHMCPSADRTSSIVANSSTFLMTNIVMTNFLVTNFLVTNFVMTTLEMVIFVMRNFAMKNFVMTNLLMTNFMSTNFVSINFVSTNFESVNFVHMKFVSTNLVSTIFMSTNFVSAL
jgi:hypothetical protein